MRTQRKFLSLLVVFCMLLAMLPTAFAADEPALNGTCGDNLTWELTENGGTVTVDEEELPAYTLTISGTGDMEDFGYQVPWESFHSCITKVVMENGITSIGSSAFASCYSLTSVEIPDSVTDLGMYAFDFCTGLTSVKIGNGVTGIKEGTFYGCESLTSVEIGNSVTYIQAYAFCGCESLTSVTIPDSVTDMDGESFYACRNLTSIDVSEGNQTYASQDGVVYSKDGTELIAYPNGKEGAFVIPEGVTSFGFRALRAAKGMTSVEIPNSVTSIGSGAFMECTGLTSVEIPNSVTSIGHSAFSECTNLTSVTIPASVTSIEQSAFYDCTNLTSVTIPASVTSIGSRAFGYYFDTSINEVAKIDGFVIYGYTGTAAETYATENGIPFVSLGKVDTHEGPAVLTGGTSKSYVQESGEDASIHCSGDLNDLVSVSVDGEVVAEDNYTLTEGSTIVTFKSAYLDTLSVGEHTVTLTYTTGTASTTLTVLEKGTQQPADPENPGDQNPENPGDEGTGSEGTAPSDGSDVPQTGDSFTAVWACLLMIALAGAVMMAVNRRNWFKF